MASNLDSLRTLAEKQHGVITAGQARECGLHYADLTRWMRRGWRRVMPGVYALGPGEFEQQAMAACLWGGADALVSHRAAARLYRLDGFDRAEVEITVPPGSRTRCAVPVHRADIPREDRREFHGIPLTSAARTLLDISGQAGLLELAMAVDDAWRRKLVPLGWLERLLRERGARGRRGTALLRRVLDDAWERGRPMDSALEVKMWWTLKIARLPMPIPQFPFDDDWGQPGRIDFAWPDRMVALETDGAKFHGPDARERDALRLSRLAALGWRVLHFTWAQLKDPAPVLGLIKDALGAEAGPRRVRPPALAAG